MNSISDILRDSYRDLTAATAAASPPGPALERLLARAGRGQSGEIPEPPRLDQYLATLHAPPGATPKISGHRHHPERGEAEMICEILGELAAALDPPGADGSRLRDAVPEASSYLAEAARQLSLLRQDIAVRTATRDSAARALRRAEHNIAEAVQMTRPGRRRNRAARAAIRQDMSESAQTLSDLRPRIMRLFQDSPAPAPLINA